MKPNSWWCLILIHALVLISALVTPAVAEDKALTNQDVMKMVGAGLSEDLVIAKVRQTSRIEFKLDVDDLVALRKAGVSEKVIKAMLERSSGLGWANKPAAPQNADLAASWANPQEDLGVELIKVALVGREGTLPIRILRGEMTTTGFGPYRNAFMDYAGLHAKVRTRDRRPSLLVKSSAPLTGGRYFLAKLDVDDDDGVRSLKISSAKNRLKAAFGGSDRGLMEPDPDWVVPFESTEEGPELWRVTVKADLEPGEYGWYVDLGTGVQSASIFDFGVD